MNRLSHARVDQLQQVKIPCGCILHESGLILTICDKDAKKVDPDRIIALMLAANAKIAAVIERIDTVSGVIPSFGRLADLLLRSLPKS